MIRQLLLALSENERVHAFVLRQRMARRAARRFVAGETLDEALGVVDRLAAEGYSLSLNLLGEKTTSPQEARAATDVYAEAATRLRGRPVDCYISVKLTQLGLDLDTDLAADNLRRLLEATRADGRFVRVDMEHSPYIDRTLEIITRLKAEGYDALGAVIQAYLYRSEDDVDRLLKLGIPIRLCKGAYAEPPTVAYPHKRDVDANFIRIQQRLLRDSVSHAIATHDERLIQAAVSQVEKEGIPRDRCEFQFIYGIRRDLQERLHRGGHRVRIYVPYGTHWYPYLMRRMAERPANLAFILRNLLRG
ncbi:MAG: proline dehydrogenase family protein [bacterium]|nr:proline dehydrogenase family protein [bacterium]